MRFRDFNVVFGRHTLAVTMQYLKPKGQETAKGTKLRKFCGLYSFGIPIAESGLVLFIERRESDPWRAYVHSRREGVLVVDVLADSPERAVALCAQKLRVDPRRYRMYRPVFP